MRTFKVTYGTVYLARLHAGEHGGARPVPPSIAGFRIKPEQVEYLNDFVNRPEYTQVVASNKGAQQWVVELSLRPEALMRKYHQLVPASLRIGRTEVLEYMRQSCFRLQRAKACLCGLCEEHGWQNFEDLKQLINDLGLGQEATTGFLLRVTKLQEYLKQEYRRLCTNTMLVGCQGSATLCIPFALSGEGEFACSCGFTGDHVMDFQPCNERFYLIADLRTALEARLRQMSDALGAIGPDESDDEADHSAHVHMPDAEAEGLADSIAELDERAEELASCEKHLDLYVRHLLRKALSSSITIEMLEMVKANPKRVHLIFDYKQKVLPEKHRSTQTMAFGKKGKSLHGCAALRWDAVKEDYNVLNIRVACDDSNQTCAA